ncbi:MAG TPA: aromatic ring-hydroxylating dioxygenase subunit alpha, partial [Sphingobium sp.]|nr:aromatic ring-hydroxylating dioxygenase subunit alpha [Sphingobium sp.]
TPETEHSSHYFWAIGRTNRIDDAEMTARAAAMVNKVFTTQDAPMIEAQQEALGENTDFLDQKPIILKADAAGVLARRTLKRRIKQEQGEADTVAIATAAE